MIQQNKFLFILLPTLLLLSACVRPSATTSPACVLAFEGTIRNGPNADLSLTGNLGFMVYGESSGLTGTLKLEDGKEIPVTGQATGRAINLILDLGSDSLIYATGTAQNAMNYCQGSAGGSLVGPLPGDSGDWFGKFDSVAAGGSPADSQPTSSSKLGQAMVLGATAMVILVGIAFAALLMQGQANTRLRKKRPQAGAGSAGRKVTPEDWHGEAEKPVAQYLTTYLGGDSRFDMSFSIEAGTDYLGECGAAVAGYLLNNPSKQAAAIEVWLFDKNDIRTVTYMLLSEANPNEIVFTTKAGQKNKPIAISPGAETTIETTTLRMKVKVAELVYAHNTSRPRNAFNRLTLKLGVWRK